MNAKIQKLFDTELTDGERRELRRIFETNEAMKNLKTAINVDSVHGKFTEVLELQRLVSKMEDTLFAAYAQARERTGVKPTSVYGFIDDKDKDRFATLANKTTMLINLLDNAYQDMTSIMEKNGYAPETIERMTKVGKEMADEMRKIFGELPEEFADDFDDACSKVDVLIDNKVRAFLRQQQKKQFTNKQKTNNYERD